MIPRSTLSRWKIINSLKQFELVQNKTLLQSNQDDEQNIESDELEFDKNIIVIILFISHIHFWIKSYIVHGPQFRCTTVGISCDVGFGRNLSPWFFCIYLKKKEKKINYGE